MAPILKIIFVAPILKNIFVAPILNKNDSCGTNTEEKAIFVAPILKTFCGTNTGNFYDNNIIVKFSMFSLQCCQLLE